MQFRIRTGSLPCRQKIHIRSLHQLLPSKTQIQIPEQKLGQKIFTNPALRTTLNLTHHHHSHNNLHSETHRPWHSNNNNNTNSSINQQKYHKYRSTIMAKSSTSKVFNTSRQSFQQEVGSELRKRSTMPHFRYRSVDMEESRRTNMASPMWTAVHYQYIGKKQDKPTSSAQKSGNKQQPQPQKPQQYLKKGSNINKRVVVNLLKLKLSKTPLVHDGPFPDVNHSIDNTIRNNEILQMIKIYKGYGQAYDSMGGMGGGSGLGLRKIDRMKEKEKENDLRDELKIKTFPFKNLNIELSVSGWRNRKNQKESMPNSPLALDLEQKLQPLQ